MDTITPIQLKELLDSDNPPMVLDVRETIELNVCKFPNVLHIPLGNLTTEWQLISKDRLIITICHHGYRSMQAAMFLESHGYQVKNMVGGVHAWAKQVDPTMAVY